MSKPHVSETPATRALRQAGVAFTEHPYAYEDKGGTRVSARELGVDEYCVIKTLVMEDETHKPVIVLMHGTLQVSTKELARALGVKRVEPCKPEIAQKHTGYLVGGTSPFGTRKDLPVCMEETIATLPRIYINGGKRGYLVGMSPGDLEALLKPRRVKVGLPRLAPSPTPQPGRARSM